MRRVVRLLVPLVLAVGVAALVGPVAPASAAGPAVAVATVPAAATPAACTGTVQIVSLAFSPPSVPAGQSSVAQLTARNCTDQALAVSVTWTAQLIWPAGGIPPGCAVIDPLLRPATIPANGQLDTGQGYTVFSQCQATTVRVTARIGAADGTPLASQSADLTIAKATAPCRISYQRQSEWPGGFVATVTITNTGTAPVSGWSVGFTFPGDQRTTNVWNATVNQSGPALSAGSLSYNREIAPGASTSFGFVGSWVGNDTSPTTFTLNGAVCATG